MIKRIVIAALLAASAPAFAAPTLTMDPYGPDTATVAQPDAAEITINGGAPIACQLVAVSSPAGGKQPRCDLSGITSSGTYTLAVTVKRAASCGNTSATAGQCTFGGSASSAPFAYTARSGSVAAPSSPQLSAQ